MPLSIGVWLFDELECVPDIALVRREEWISFADLCRTGHIPTPKDLFVLEPNGDRHSELLSFYIGEKNYPGNYVVRNQGAFAQIFSAWVKLTQRIDSFDFGAADLLCDYIQEMAGSHVPEISDGLRELRHFIEVGIGAYRAPSLFRTYHAGGAAQWWLLPIACLPAIETFAQRQKVAELSAAAAAMAKKLNSISGMSAAQKFYQLSALCLSLSKRRIACADYQGSFLLTYRALDLYFQHLGLINSLLIETASDISYKSKAERVYLVDVEYELVRGQSVASDLSRRDKLVKLNKIRNQLLQTHGAHHVLRSEAESAISEALETVSKLEGNKRWEVTAEGFFPKHSTLKACLFGMLPDIDTFLEPVSII
jgi:hypothetical protein